MQKILEIIIFITLFLGSAVNPLYSQEIWTMGGQAEWTHISQADGITGESREGLSPVLMLSGNQPEIDDVTDFYLPADKDTQDASGHYTLLEDRAAIDKEPHFRGGGAVIFNRTDQYLVYRAEKGALFYPGSHPDDFSIEFRIYPSQLENYEELLSWEGLHQSGGQLFQQKFQVVSEKRTLKWSFENLFFTGSDRVMPTIELKGLDPLYPGRWTSHLLRYRAEDGLMEYYTDGKLQDIAYLRDTRTGDVYYPHAGKQTTGRLILGKTFLGRMDEVRISSCFRNEESLLNEFLPKGTLLFGPYDMGYSNSRVLEFSSDYSLPSDSAVYFSLALSDNRYTRNEWTQIGIGSLEDLDLRGRYIFLKAELYSSGSYSHSPELNSLTLTYEPDLPPPPPMNLTVTALDKGRVRLSWQPVIQSDIRGYNIYYGTEPGVYLSSGADQGPSPVFTENNNSLVLSGLTERQIYYFTVRAVDKAEPSHESRFSNETGIRP